MNSDFYKLLAIITVPTNWLSLPEETQKEIADLLNKISEREAAKKQ